MKVGDLVRWTSANDLSLGVVLKVATRPTPQDKQHTRVEIYWFEDGRSCGYNVHHPNIEVVNESR